MWVVKLGGSLLGSPELSRWLETLVKISDGKVIIVPGGGLFADAVRVAQQHTQVSDAVAHHLALLAMDQFGLLLAGMNVNLVTASSELEIAERGWQHRATVWLPSKMVLADDTVPKTWQVTSDSLSAWLANRVGAEQLVIVKSQSLTAYPKTTTVSLQTLVDDALIDEGFSSFISGAQYQVNIVNKADCHWFAQGLNAEYLKNNSMTINMNKDKR
jgi:aspartokinase-like uncharacterized kinase